MSYLRFVGFDSLKNIKLFLEHIAHQNGKEIQSEETHDFIQFDNSVWPNLIFNLRLKPNSFDAWLSNIQKRIKTENHPMHFMCNELDLNPEILQRFKKFQPANRQWASMTFDLSKDIELKKLPSFKIKRVYRKNDINEWCQVAKDSLFQKRKLDFDLFHALVDSDKIEFYSGFLNNKAAAVSMLFEENDWAGIYCVGTLPEFERNGYGKAVTQFAMLEGKKKGCKKAVLQATEDGEFVYNKIGYDTFGKIDLFNLSS